MTKRMIKYNDIEQFRSIIRNVQKATQYVGYNTETDEVIMDRTIKMPVIKASGSEKIHGTNAAVSFTNAEGLWVQARNDIITIEKDNAACAFNTTKHIDEWTDIVLSLAEFHNINLDENILTVYFEWAGGNIQKNSAVSGLEKMSFIFRHFKVSPIEQTLDANGKQVNAYWLETHIADNVWISNDELKIYNVMNFPTWEFEIDFDQTGIAQNAMIDVVLKEIEPASPLGKQLGKEENVGEGMVVTFLYKEVLYKFKVKGDKHSNSKVKTLKPVDTVKEQNKIDFANLVCTPGRLVQAWQLTFGIENEKMVPTVKETGNFLRAVIADVWKEESDIAAEKGLEPKEVNSLISKVARTWFMTELDKEFGLK